MNGLVLRIRPVFSAAALVSKRFFAAAGGLTLLACLLIPPSSLSAAPLRITFSQLNEPALSAWAAQGFSSVEAFVAPPSLRALDGADVMLTGYVLPIRYEGVALREFALLRNQQACCFGQTPGPLEAVFVSVEGAAPQLPQDVPTTVRGRFALRPEFNEGRMWGLYTLRVSGSAGFEGGLR